MREISGTIGLLDTTDAPATPELLAWHLAIGMQRHPPVVIGADRLAEIDRRTPYQDAVAASVRARNAELELARFDPRDTERAA